jgi:hypothetical protein
MRDNKPMAVASHGRIVGYGDSSDHLERTASRLRDADIAELPVAGEIAAAWHQNDFSILKGELAPGVLEFPIHAHHDADRDGTCTSIVLLTAKFVPGAQAISGTSNSQMWTLR